MDSKFFKKKRREFAKIVENGIVIFHSGIPKRVSTHETFPFRPNKHFFYLTGLTDPSIIAIFIIQNKALIPKLFIPPIDEVKQRWDGKQLTKQEAAQISGIPEDSINELPKINVIWQDLEKKYNNLPLWVNKADKQFSQLQYHFELEFKRKKSYCFHSIVSRMRGIKAPEEIRLIREAGKIAARGIEAVMKCAKPNMYEYELESVHDYMMKFSGIKSEQFKTILASGENTTILHYLNNDALIKENDLILIDIDVELDNYHTDITRTFPANGKFSQRQKLVYEEVLDAQLKLIQSVKPGIAYGELNQMSQELLSESCKRLGLISDSQDIHKYYFHNVGHAIGLDTHDVFDFDDNTLLEPGMVLTIEPGLYIPEENIGIRIEDVILVTKDGSENLTRHLIKNVEDIELLMKIGS